MTFNHLGLNIQEKEEVQNFYQNILGFNPAYNFIIEKAFAKDIFGVADKSEVFLCKRGNLNIELFVYPRSSQNGFTHACLEFENRDTIAQKGEQQGYPVIRIERDDKQDLLFLKDKAGNIFELKNKDPK